MATQRTLEMKRIDIKKMLTLKRILILAYVASVLLIAGLAQANPSMPVSAANYYADQQKILVQGYFADACQKFPRPEVVRVDHRSRSVLVRIVPMIARGQNCNQIIGGGYDLIVDVASLGLPDHATYEVRFERADVAVSPLVVRQNGLINSNEFSSLNISGLVVHDRNGFAVRTRSESLKITPSLMDISQYVGKVVDVSGHKNEFSLMPIVTDDFASHMNSDGELPGSLTVNAISTLD